MRFGQRRSAQPPSRWLPGAVVCAILGAMLIVALAAPAMAGNVHQTLYPVATQPRSEDSFQPSAPYYATVYYPWYGTPAADGAWSHWSSQGNVPPATWFSHYLPDPLPSQFDPSRELYSSSDASTIYWQLAKMAEARFEVAISSWWGKDDSTDSNFRFIVKEIMKRSDNPYPNLRWALYYETESTSDPSPAAIAADLDYIANNYAGEPAYLKIGDRPVIFVYSSSSDSTGLAQRWNDAKALAKVPFYVVLKVFTGYKKISPQPDSWHQYAPAKAASDHSPYSFSVSPGFWYDSGDTAPRLVRDLAEFRSTVGQMVAAKAAWKLVTTWNEWGEGTSVEPGEQVRLKASGSPEEPDPNGALFKNTYVDVLHELLPPLEAGTGATGVAMAAANAVVTATVETSAIETPNVETGSVPTSTEEMATVPTAMVPASAPVSASMAITQAAGAESFSFGAAGDLSGMSRTTESLDGLARSGADFFLAIGDMSYNDITPESAWCQYVKQHVGDSYPFEVLVGNHEETPAGPNGFIDNFAACLPDRLGVTGTYAHRYYFDYPASAPLARFILIDPDLYRGDTVAQYCTGGDTDNCDWLKARIDEAKSQGLWTIVGMHKNCLTMGEKSCEIGAGLLSVLVERKVDLILQGHDHSYQRSKQLSLGASCPALKANALNAGCVVDDGIDDRYTKGNGPVLVISGLFGRRSYQLDPADPEAPYFATWMETNNPTNGFVKFTVSKDALDGQFVNVRGTFTDHFIIAARTP